MGYVYTEKPGTDELERPLRREDFFVVHTHCFTPVVPLLTAPLAILFVGQRHSRSYIFSMWVVLFLLSLVFGLAVFGALSSGTTWHKNHRAECCHNSTNSLLHGDCTTTLSQAGLNPYALECAYFGYTSVMLLELSILPMIGMVVVSWLLSGFISKCEDDGKSPPDSAYVTRFLSSVVVFTCALTAAGVLISDAYNDYLTGHILASAVLLIVALVSFFKPSTTMLGAWFTLLVLLVLILPPWDKNCCTDRKPKQYCTDTTGCDPTKLWKAAAPVVMFLSVQLIRDVAMCYWHLSRESGGVTGALRRLLDKVTAFVNRQSEGDPMLPEQQ